MPNKLYILNYSKIPVGQMKIAIVQPTLEYGGAEKVILRIAERFNA